MGNFPAQCAECDKKDILRDKKIDKKRKKCKTPLQKKPCDNCGQEFQPRTKMERFCHAPCDKMGYKDNFQKFIDGDKRNKPKKPGAYAAFAYSFFKKKFDVSDVYKVVRG